MRSISTIKSAVDKRPEDKPIPEKKTLKTPATVRAKQKKDDSTLKLQKQLERKARALQEAIKKKNRNLSEIRDEIIEKTEKAIEAGDEIIDAAKKRADSIISVARSDRDKAKAVRIKAEKQGQELDKFEEKLKKTKEQTDMIQKNVSNNLKTSKKTLQVAQDKDARSTKKLNQAQESLDSMFTLLFAVIEKVLPIAENNDVLLQTISTNMSKADKMYSQLLNMENAVRIEKEVNKQKAVKLNEKEIWLKDRQQMLIRSTKELTGK